MKRVWIGWAGVVLVILALFLGLGFFGVQALQLGLPVIALTIATVLLPGGELWWKGAWLIAGVIVAMLGFLLGAGVFPDSPIGYALGGIVPVTLVALATMWTKRITYFLAAVFGVAAFQAVYTAFFFSDPQSINFSMPIAFGITLAPMALAYLVFGAIATYLPKILEAQQAKVAVGGAHMPAASSSSGTSSATSAKTATQAAKSAAPTTSGAAATTSGNGKVGTSTTATTTKSPTSVLPSSATATTPAKTNPAAPTKGDKA